MTDVKHDANGKNGNKAAGPVAEKAARADAAAVPAHTPANDPANKNGDENGDESRQKTSGKGAGRSPDKSPDKPPAKVPEKAPERARAADPGAPSTTTGRPRAAFVEPSLQAVDALDCEAIALGITSDLRPLAGFASYVDWRLCGRVSELLRKGTLTGAAREKVLMPTLGMIPARRIFLFGWGPRASLLDGATERFAWMVDVLLQAGVERVAVALPEPAAMLLGLVDEHVRKPLGDKCAVVFAPDPWLVEPRDTRPIPAP